MEEGRKKALVERRRKAREGDGFGLIMKGDGGRTLCASVVLRDVVGR